MPQTPSKTQENQIDRCNGVFHAGFPTLILQAESAADVFIGTTRGLCDGCSVDNNSNVLRAAPWEGQLVMGAGVDRKHHQHLSVPGLSSLKTCSSTEYEQLKWSTVGRCGQPGIVTRKRKRHDRETTSNMFTFLLVSVQLDEPVDIRWKRTQSSQCRDHRMEDEGSDIKSFHWRHAL